MSARADLAWRCDMHGVTTTGDCPRCDDELIAMTDSPADFFLDELEESRPVDLDDCPSCGGGGLVEVIDWMVTGGPVDVTCPACGGTGERGVA